MSGEVVRYVGDPDEVTGVAVPIDSEVEIRIKENGLGLFQVWNTVKALEYLQELRQFFFTKKYEEGCLSEGAEK